MWVNMLMLLKVKHIVKGSATNTAPPPLERVVERAWLPLRERETEKTVSEKQISPASDLILRQSEVFSVSEY